ncbi:MAG: hypothetical protein DSY53_03020 [Persephonella sp.]|nr:MAG: hypothetical protein DSY53_03020 [Persephonella sp.]
MLKINDLEKIFIGRFNIEDFKILPKGNEYSKELKGYKKIVLNKNYILAIKGNIDLDKLIKIRDFLAEFIEKDSLINFLVRKVEVLEREFINLSTINQFIVSTDLERDVLEKFFSTLENEFYYAFIKNDEVLINKGINPTFLKIIEGKLKKADKISFKYLNGEVFAIKNNFIAFILYSPKGYIDSFYKELIEVKLFLLMNVLIYLGEYSIDELTGFYSRKKLFMDIKHLKNKVGLMINIRNFNYINNVFGIDFGDKVLKEFANIMEELLKKNKGIYRITGDKFLILFNKVDESKKFFNILDRIMQSGINVFHDSTQEFITLKLSIQGVLIKKLTQQYIESAIVYLKRHRFNNKTIIDFEEEILPLLTQDLESLEIVQKAIAGERIFPAFQKILNLKEDNDYYYEALMRIKLGDTVYSPGQFLEIAKEKGLYPKLSNILLRRALNYASYLKKKVSINLEISDILRKDFINKIIRLTNTSNIPPENIVLEITEREYMGNYFEDVKKSIYKLKSIGFSIAIDDFGSGYSNFQYLTEIPIDIIKIDGSLIRNITSNEKQKYIVSSIVSMAKLLDIKTVAEFVSSEEIFEEVVKLDIDYAQGFYIDKPKFIEEILEEEKIPEIY